MADEPLVNTSNAVRPGGGDYSEVIENIKKGGYCPFCEENFRINHKKPILKKTEYWTLTENMWPYEGAKVHLLLIHTKHITSVAEISPEAWLELRILAAEIAVEFNLKGMTMLMRSGDTSSTGATVTHLHVNFVSSNPTEPGYKPVVTRVG